VGYLCLHENVDVVPMYLDGTHDALPVGAWAPRRRRLRAVIGPPIRADEQRRRTEGQSRSGAYREVTLEIENAVRRLGGLPLRREEREDATPKRSDGPRSGRSREPNA